MTVLDKVLVAIDRNPISALYRIAIGYIFIPTLSFLRFDIRSGWTLTLSLLVLLISLRIGPAVMRKVLPLSAAAKAVWTERRGLAKRYDSFQWQKLFFIGLGIGCYVVISGEMLASTIALSGFCLFGGVIGLIKWYSRANKVRTTLVHKYVI
jgi:hypothetical protein